MPSNQFTTAVLLVCLNSLVSLGQGPAPVPGQIPGAAAAPVQAPPVDQPMPAEFQLEVSIIRVRVMERIAAKLEQDVDMLNQKFKLEGNYFKDTGHRIRLQLNLVGLGDTGSTMLQVCDGKILWDFQKVLNMQSYKKREIAPIFERLNNPILDDQFRSLVISNMGFGGPEAMMMGLKKAVKFDQISESKLDGVDVFILGGTWRDRSNLMGPNDRPLAPTAPLPPYIPSNVRVFVGKENGWPYKIEMIGNAPSLLQQDTRAIDPTSGRPIGRPMPPPKVDPSKVTLLYKILPLTEITQGLFDFTAPAEVASTNVIDETEQFLAMLDQVIQNETNKKKAEAAAKGENEPLLKVSPIEVKPPDTAPPK